MASFSTAVATKQDYPEIAKLRVVPKPLYLVGTQVRQLNCPGGWEAFTDDLSKLYQQDTRWCGGRFHLWTLEVYGDWRRRPKVRQGYWLTNTGVFIYTAERGITDLCENF